MDTISTFHTAHEENSAAVGGNAEARTRGQRKDRAKAATGRAGKSAKTEAETTRSAGQTTVTSLMPDNIETDPRILDYIRSRPAAPMTEEQMRAQRVSFVYGNMPQSSRLSRDDVEALLSRTGSAHR